MCARTRPIGCVGGPPCPTGDRHWLPTGSRGYQSGSGPGASGRRVRSNYFPARPLARRRRWLPATPAFPPLQKPPSPFLGASAAASQKPTGLPFVSASAAARCSLSLLPAGLPASKPAPDTEAPSTSYATTPAGTPTSLPDSHLESFSSSPVGNQGTPTSAASLRDLPPRLDTAAQCYCCEKCTNRL